MNVVPVLVFCSLFLALCGLGLYVWSVHRGDHEHADRLSLLPLEEDQISRPDDSDDDDDGRE